MSSQDRIRTVLRVRRIQELQAAGELARTSAAARAVEEQLVDLRRRYDDERHRDAGDDLVPARLRERTTRELQADAIRRGRDRVRDALSRVDDARLVLQVRSQAVRAMERLDERLAEEAAAELRRAEVRELDERGAALAWRRALATEASSVSGPTPAGAAR